MNDYFYYAGIIFIIDALRCSFSVKREIDDYKAGIKLPDSNMSYGELEKLKDSLIGDLKGKIIPALLGLLLFVWNIIGIFYTPECKLFIINIMCIFIGTMAVGYNKKYRTPIIGIIYNIIPAAIITLILYNHFS